jgi:UDP-N-acetylglucosamine 2-epimerase (non-hydrolysing)
MRVVCVAGARPNFMKIKPVVDALESRGASVLVVHTEQHYDDAMSEVFLNELGLRSPDIRLGAGSGTHAQQTARVMEAFERFLHETAPDATIVVGDVNSTLACALVAAKSSSLLGHVEAGLRSRDRSMPEEINRIVTDAISDVLFAPSRDAVDNLTSEGHTEDRILLVGNVMIDTLMANLDRAKARPILATLGVSAGEYGLVTLHRPTNVDDPDVLSRILGALGKIAVHLPIIFPVHPRTRAQLDSGIVPDRIGVVDPLGYLDFVALECQARLVFTDSGGVQEETTVLGVPCLTLRDTTERPITVLEGTNMVVGQRPDVIAHAASLVLENPPSPRRPELWDGHASERIADALLQAVPQ